MRALRVKGAKEVEGVKRRKEPGGGGGGGGVQSFELAAFGILSAAM